MDKDQKQGVRCFKNLPVSIVSQKHRIGTVSNKLLGAEKHNLKTGSKLEVKGVIFVGQYGINPHKSNKHTSLVPLLFFKMLTQLICTTNLKISNGVIINKLKLYAVKINRLQLTKYNIPPTQIMKLRENGNF